MGKQVYEIWESKTYNCTTVICLDENYSEQLSNLESDAILLESFQANNNEEAFLIFDKWIDS